MSGIDPTSKPLQDLWTRLTTGAPPNPSAPSAAAPTLAERDAAYDDVLDRLPASAMAAPVMLNATSDGSSTPVRLDVYKARMSGPYDVDGQQVTAPPQFRMNDGFNGAAAFGTSPADRAIQGRLNAAAAKAGMAGQVEDLRYGRGTPEALVRVTQALIDAGELPSATKARIEAAARQNQRTPSTADCIQALQWKFGIGVDCAGYVYGALAALQGDPTKLGLASRGNEDLRGLASNPHFTKVDASVARPGDVIVLEGKGTSADPGHNLIVYSHTILRGDVKEAVPSACLGNPDAATFLKVAKGVNGRPDTVERYEVDSSFSAGSDGTAYGGARRDVLLRNERTGKWLTLSTTPTPRVTVGQVPFGEAALTGVFRAAVVR